MTALRGKPAQYPIRVVSKLTGIGIDALRAWERRYGIVTPGRDGRGRMYSEDDVARLRLVRQAIASGHSVGQLAKLTDEELRALLDAHAAPGELPASGTRAAGLDLAAFSAALPRLDSAAIDQEFARLATVLPPLELVRDVLMPTLREVGDRWHRQRGGIAHEHLISSIMRHLLGSYLRLHARRGATMSLVCATPAGERHEVGILGAAMLAASAGLRVVYLGPDLPAGEIVEAVRSAGAEVLVLGLTLADAGRQRKSELRAIVRALPPEVELWAGGHGAARHAGLISPRGMVLGDFDAYWHQIERLSARAM